ncbi:hypothetical protein NGB36_08270 [Streptomyces sp. RB6PN25]|uniref:Uncharacterized protein n=1 Tax=Streptomyces humicola TaxID=2953240 RepID=A0ABT1PSE9_9ACTN|nr:hypothetical protein [Streptomyces humicola]MCQ4080597.1 hypothetical protein [Streptomyces humicola]
MTGAGDRAAARGGGAASASRHPGDVSLRRRAGTVCARRRRRVGGLSGHAEQLAWPEIVAGGKLATIVPGTGFAAMRRRRRTGRQG